MPDKQNYEPTVPDKQSNHRQVTPDSGTQKMTPKRLAAIIGILILVAMYIITLVVAIVSPDDSGRMFAMCLFATLVIPITIWVYVWMYGKLTSKKTFADFDAGISSDFDAEIATDESDNPDTDTP